MSYPQHQMRIDFRPHVAISTGFTDWLERLLEPAVEDRFRTAQGALSSLQVEWGKQRLASADKPPKGSRMVCQVKDDRLIVKLPPPWGGGCVYTPMLMAFLLLFIPLLVELIRSSVKTLVEFASSGVTAAAMENGTTSVLVLFVILFFGVIITYLLLASRYFRLEITPEIFRVQWRYCLIFRHRVQGRTQDIEKVVIQRSYLATKGNSAYRKFRYRGYASHQSSPAMVCTLVEGFRTYSFGISLSDEQRQWLVKQISLFLRRIQV